MLSSRVARICWDEIGRLGLATAFFFLLAHALARDATRMMQLEIRDDDEGRVCNMGGRWRNVVQVRITTARQEGRKLGLEK